MHILNTVNTETLDECCMLSLMRAHYIYSLEMPSLINTIFFKTDYMSLLLCDTDTDAKLSYLLSTNQLQTSLKVLHMFVSPVYSLEHQLVGFK